MENNDANFAIKAQSNFAKKNTSQSSQTSHLDFMGLLILILPPLFWAGNFVIGRAVRGAIPPVTLSFGRWLIALVILFPLAWKIVVKDKQLYWQYRWRVLGVSLIGVTAFNSLVYAGLTTTTATNGVLLNSFSPILVLAFGILFYQQRARGVQILGLLISLLGVMTIILQGNISNLLSLSFAIGDVLILTAVTCWAIYTLWLRKLPAEMNKVGLTLVQIFITVIFLFPFFLWEYSTGARTVWSWQTIGAFLYVGLFPSVIAYLLYTIGVTRVGAAKASLFLHLMPVFGTLLSVIFLGEDFYLYHFIGIGTIFAGITLSTYPFKDKVTKA